MHETLSKNVKGFIENNVYISSEKYLISGWAASLNHKIVRFIITDDNENFVKSTDTINDRIDVVDAYNGNKFYLKSGFSIELKVLPKNYFIFLNA